MGRYEQGDRKRTENKQDTVGAGGKNNVKRSRTLWTAGRQEQAEEK